MQIVNANPEPSKRRDATLCVCPHEKRVILIIYKSDNPKELLCKSCYENTYIVNHSEIDTVFDIETGEKLF